MPPIEAVFLDVGGVFHLPVHEPIVGALRERGIEIDPDLLDRAHYAGAAAYRRGHNQKVHPYIVGYAGALGIGDDSLEPAIDALGRVFRNPGVWARIIPGSIEGLRRLAETKVALAIVSNADGTMEARLLEEKICQVGEGEGVPVVMVCDSTAVGVAKPDPGIFKIALDAVGVAPENAVHVGDTVEADVKGALAAGVTPLHIDPHHFCSDSSHDHVKTLDDVTTIVRES